MRAAPLQKLPGIMTYLEPLKDLKFNPSHHAAPTVRTTGNRVCDLTCVCDRVCDRVCAGDVINRLSSDTVVVQKALTTNIANGLRSTAMVVGTHD